MSFSSGKRVAPVLSINVTLTAVSSLCRDHKTKVLVLTVIIGYTILDASLDNCDNSTWTDLLSNCEECANTYNILRHYGDQVESAAEDCGLGVTFSPSAGASSTSALAQTSSVAALSSDAATTSASLSGDAASTTTTSHGTSASGTIVPSSTSNTSTLATSPATPSETAVEESTGAGAKLGSPYGAAILAVLTLTGVFLQTMQ